MTRSMRFWANVRAVQDRKDQKVDELLSRVEVHGKWKHGALLVDIAEAECVAIWRTLLFLQLIV
ncbi:hypothetical protein ACE41H_15490 [Paenibacillus enshidis]|uniref:Uncharacterized protein n=1 Tax=Paenibacillus enshidis TaxID=1458439 RepID=A0ABV5AVD8_9BACL